VEIIVVAVDLLVSDRPIESVFLIAPGGIKISAWIRQVGDVGQTLGVRRIGRQRERTGGSGQHTPAAEGQMLRRGKTIGDFPTAVANDVHGAGSQNPRLRRTRRGVHWQVTVTGKSKACLEENKQAGVILSATRVIGLLPARISDAPASARITQV